ncbi:MAG: SDR family oxidoreductase [Phycisphaerales bacterium]|nr:SDR family oxidoreductase [Phycisphaerales bacterium]
MPGRRSIITGAGSGIGRALAILLAKGGHRVALSGRTRHRLEETASLCGQPPERVLVHAADLRVPAEAHGLIDATVAHFGGVDTLINCAGAAPLVAIENTDEALLRDTFAINALGPAALIHRCWPHFVAQRMGRVVNVSTLGTTDPFPGYFAYAAAKSALDSMTRSVAREGSEHGITAFSVNLGCIETEMLRKNFSLKQIPASRTHPPELAAAFIKEFVDGLHDAESGSCTPLLGP